jgi:CheY-like chemotaxis protein
MTTTQDALDTRALVLVVDDNTDHAEFIRLAVWSRYRVVTASNGLDAYTLACRLHPDAILLDVMLPVLDGHAVMRKLRENPETARTPIVFVTALDAKSVDALADIAEPPVVLRKPCHRGEILDALKSVLQN